MVTTTTYIQITGSVIIVCIVSLFFFWLYHKKNKKIKQNIPGGILEEIKKEVMGINGQKESIEKEINEIGIDRTERLEGEPDGREPRAEKGNENISGTGIVERKLSIPTEPVVNSKKHKRKFKFSQG